MALRVSSSRWFLRDLPRTYSLLGVAAFGAGIIVFSINWTHVRRETPEKPNLNIATDANNDQQYTGSIIFPIRGNLCRQIILDNRTGNMSEKGYVKCDEAISELEEKSISNGYGANRLLSVSKAFNKSQ